MFLGRNDFLCLSVEKRGMDSLWSTQKGKSRIVLILDPPLWHHSQRVQFLPHNMAGLPDHLVECVSVCCPSRLQLTWWHWPPQAHRTFWALSGRCWRTSTTSGSRDRFGAASQPPQHVLVPVQFTVQVHPQVPVLLHHLHSGSMES